MTRYCLAEHVHVCRVGAHIVALDVKQDRYLAVKADATACLAELVPGWPAQDEDPASAPPTHAMALAEQLARRGILSTSGGKPATPVRCNPARSELLTADAAATDEMSLASVAGIVAGVFAAAWTLRRCSFEQLIRRVAVRKLVARRDAAAFDFERARTLIAILRRLRPYLYTSRNACLFDSFALLELLARQRMYPDWVFAVQASPFGAHCWLQHEGIVVNDTCEHVAPLTPIMVV
jgi:hypothetical protein